MLVLFKEFFPRLFIRKTGGRREGNKLREGQTKTFLDKFFSMCIFWCVMV